MDKLLPCQMGTDQAAEKLQESFDYMSSVFPVERRRPATIELLSAISVAISVLRAQPENKPLTPDELREMDGEPVWLETGEVSIGEQIVGRWEILEKVTTTPVVAFWFTRRKLGLSDINYGKTWLAYRYKPEEVRG